MRKDTVDIDILVTSRNSDRKKKIFFNVFSKKDLHLNAAEISVFIAYLTILCNN